MKACLDNKPLVLFLGSPLYVQRFDRDPLEPTDLGVAYESVKVVRRLYDNKQRNEGWLWCAVPDALAPDACVPDELKDHCAPYSLPSKVDRLLAHLAHHATKTDPVPPKLPTTAKVAPPVKTFPSPI